MAEALARISAAAKEPNGFCFSGNCGRKNLCVWVDLIKKMQLIFEFRKYCIFHLEEIRGLE